ncbi:MAG: hypothetical protein WC856_07670, partial [Methylococcaceae bacterium]
MPLPNSKFRQYRDQHPEYSSMSDADLFDAVYQTEYSQYPKDAVAKLVGYEDPNTAPGTARNLALSFEQGVSGVGGVVGDVMERTGVAPETGRMLQESSMSAKQKLRDRQSLQFQSDSAQPLLDENNNINPEYNLSALGGTVAESLPGMIATAPVGGLLSRAASGAIGAVGVGAEAANAAGSAIGFGAAEGQQAASQNAMQTSYDIRNIDRSGKDFDSLVKTDLFQKAYWDQDESLPQNERITNALDIVATKAGDQVFRDTFASTGGVGLLTGGGVMGLTRNAILKKGAGEAVDGFGKAALKSMGAEAGQEYLQSGGEQYNQNLAKRDFVNPEQDPIEGVYNAAATGALAGAATGGIGGISALSPTPKITDVSDIGNAQTVDDAISSASAILDQPVTTQTVAGVSNSFSAEQNNVSDYTSAFDKTAGEVFNAKEATQTENQTTGIAGEIPGSSNNGRQAGFNANRIEPIFDRLPQQDQSPTEQDLSSPVLGGAEQLTP